MKFVCPRWKRWAGCFKDLRWEGETKCCGWEQRLFVLQVAFHHLCFCTISQLLNVPARFVGATWESNFSIVPLPSHYNYHLTTSTTLLFLTTSNYIQYSKKPAAIIKPGPGRFHTTNLGPLKEPFLWPFPVLAPHGLHKTLPGGLGQGISSS